jgi:hypothetical protein
MSNPLGQASWDARFSPLPGTGAMVFTLLHTGRTHPPDRSCTAGNSPAQGPPFGGALLLRPPRCGYVPVRVRPFKPSVVCLNEDSC